MKPTRFLLLLATIFALANSGHTAGTLSVSIQKPENGSAVDHRQEIGGKVSDPSAEVWVVIHPMETSDFWIQPRITVKEDGSWKVFAYFGNAGPMHKGQHY